MTHNSRWLVGILVSLSWPMPLTAQRGGCIVTETAPIYTSSSGEKSDFIASKGECVAGVKGFEREGARVHVMYIPPNRVRDFDRWMDPSVLSYFYYDCGCDKKEKCSPLSITLTKRIWNDCFATARDRLLAEAAKPAPQPVAPLTNDDVITLAKADLGDDVILSKMSTAPATHFDTSVDALLRLKAAGVGKSVIDAMVKEPERKAKGQSGADQRAQLSKASDVRVTSNSDAVKGCKALGTLHASTIGSFGGGAQGITKSLQEQAFARGANVLLMGSITAVTATDLQGSGEAYACAAE